jgi:NitT/TauT family transport system permease protein
MYRVGRPSLNSHSTKRGARGRLGPRAMRVASGLVGIVVAAFVLEIGSRFGGFDPRYVPAASTILMATVRVLATPDFWLNLVATLVAWALGLFVSILIAVPAGVVFGTWDRAYRATRLVVEFMRPIPAVALIPPAILVFGQDLQMKTVLVAWASVWPILFNTTYGMHTVDPMAIETARAFGCSGLAVLLRVRLPHSAPFIATGINVSAAIALVVVIAAEFLAGGQAGLGAWLLAWSLDPESFTMVWAGTLLVGLLGVGLALGIEALQHRLLPWHAAREFEAA